MTINQLWKYGLGQGIGGAAARPVGDDILNSGKNLNGFSKLKSGGKEEERREGAREWRGERTADVIPLRETNRSLGRNRKEIFQSEPRPLGA